MKIPLIPENENARLNALHDLRILDTPIEESFERITRLTKQFFHVPICAFTLVDAERQWFKSIQGLDVCETGRDVSFCAHAINQDDIFIVNDAAKDERFSDNPLVTSDPYIRFYAGYPIRSESGEKIGSLCIIDTIPHTYIKDELLPLKDMAALIEAEIRRKHICINQEDLIHKLDRSNYAQMIDLLTRIWNRGGIESNLKLQQDLAHQSQTGFGVVMIDIDNFKGINDTYGHAAGDQVLRMPAKHIVCELRDDDWIGRWGGEEFLAVINASEVTEIKKILERIRYKISSTPVQFEQHTLSVTITMGFSIYRPDQKATIEAVVKLADQALYEGKRSGKNTIACNDKFVASL